jgi:ribosomal protein S18 acetylase RimI-like enzyme
MKAGFLRLHSESPDLGYQRWKEYGTRITRINTEGKGFPVIIEIYPSRIDLLAEYATIPIAFEVRSIFQVEALDGGLGGLSLVEQRVSPPYIKDYDVYEDGPPTAWDRQFDMRNWGLLLAREEAAAPPVGSATIAWNTNGVNMLEGRSDLAVLWDIRVRPEQRGQGIGALLLREAANWARQRGCKLLKAETQNVNVHACRFYASQGFELGAIQRYAYTGLHVAHETMLIWYLRLA